MNFNKIRSFCRVFRTIVGLVLIATGIIQLGAMDAAPWFFLGVIPLLAGLFNFCPLCMISKKCDIPETKK